MSKKTSKPENKVMNHNLRRTIEVVFGTAHLATAIAGEGIALAEAHLLAKHRNLTNETTGEQGHLSIKENVLYRKDRSYKHRKELYNIYKDPKKALEDYRLAKIKKELENESI